MACSIVQVQSVQRTQLQKSPWQRERAVGTSGRNSGCRVEFGRNWAESGELLSRLAPVLQRKKGWVVVLPLFASSFRLSRWLQFGRLRVGLFSEEGILSS